MSKPRIHGVAKELGVDKKEIIELLARVGAKTKNHMSTLENNELDIIFDYFTTKYAVDNFDFLDEKIAAADSPDAPAKVSVGDINVDDVLQDVGESVAASKKSRIVDTRMATVDLEKFDTEKIEERLNVGVSDQLIHKEKIKKGANRAKNEKFVHHENLQKVQKVEREPIFVILPEEISVNDFANKIKVPVVDIIKALMQLGIMASASQLLDFDTVALIGTEFNVTAQKEIVITDEDILFDDSEDNEADLRPRPPVVVVMGHVDHGKTSLLDAIRNTNVQASEAGGITQHIGAHTVNIHGKDITFLDTPGHEAFTSMRARGAQLTDIAILVVAADDGIMPQTVEAINHAKDAGVNIIIAINKIDKEGANPDRVKQELTEHGLVIEEWGGDTICVHVSATKNENIDNLLEMVILASEMKELKANPKRSAKGAVIEAKLDKGRGPVATVIVQNGTLHVGDIIIAGTCVGRVRAMTDDKGKHVKKAPPSKPVEILGFSEVPEGGDIFYAVDDERRARAVVEQRKHKLKAQRHQTHKPVASLDTLLSHIQQGQVKDLNIIIKADVQGSVEAMRQSLEKLTNDEVRVRIVHGGVGTVSESDVMLASASGAIIVGFNVRPDSAIMESAARQDVEIRLYRVIYQAIEEVEAAMKGMLEPKFKENVLGHAEVRQVFKVTGSGVIGGSYVLDGKILRNSEVRVIRDGIVVYEGTLSSLRRFKDDVKEVASGYECGIGLERFSDLKEGDVVESFIMEEVKQ